MSAIEAGVEPFGSIKALLFGSYRGECGHFGGFVKGLLVIWA